jgi:hypothetical protein
MLNPEDRRAIEDLFDRLEDVAQRTGPRDPEAQDVIDRRIADQPGAPYYMAQTILVQETALREARERIAELERQPARTTPRGPWDRDEPENRRGGGFLAGAAQTALGVTGGMLLGSAIAGMFTGGANAQEQPPEAPPEEPVDEGGDDGWGGDGFDMGGDF